MSLPNNPHAIVEIDGANGLRWDSWQHQRLFEKVEVELVTNQSSEARWTVFDPEFRLIDSYTGTNGIPMLTVRVYLGYGKNLGEPVFKGLLAQVERGESSTTFVAFDMGFKMKLIKKAGYKNKKDDLAILKALAERNGLKFEGPENPKALEPHQAIMQDEMTDWEWAMERASDAGLILFVREDTLFAKYPAKTGTPILTLKNRKDFVLQSDWDFIYRTPENQDGRPRVIKRRGRGKAGRRIEGQSDVGQRGRENVILKRDVPGKASKSKLSRRAQAQKELEREHAFEGRVRIAYPPNLERLDVRNTVGIENIGKLFSGKYLCDAVSYQFGAGILEVDLELYRDIAE